MKLIFLRVALAIAMLSLATVATAHLASAQPTDSAVTVSGTGEFKDLKVTVSQTKYLINQTVRVSWTGGAPSPSGVINNNFLQIMQCWGGDSGPDRTQCQFGATDVIGVASRQITQAGKPIDPLEDLIPPLSDINDVPFWPAGQPEPKGLTNFTIGTFIDPQTTNEIPVAPTRADGNGEQFFEVQTQRQSAGLNCGAAVTVGGTVTGQSCWLVIVPRGRTEVDGQVAPNGLVSSPLSRTNWNKRIQIKLEFLPATQTCPIGAAERPVFGHEQPVDAVGRWQRALCASVGTIFSYTQLTDDSARSQLVQSSSPGLLLMNNPVPPDQVPPGRSLVYAPVTLSGLAIAFNVERQTTRVIGGGNNQSATDRTGERFDEMNLTPRLVAKLLTQSYRSAVSGSRDPKYLQGNPESLTRDEEFLKYNPDYRKRDGNGTGLPEPIVQLGTADSTALLWSWVLGDAEARAFLAGTKDEWGMVVNPANGGLDTPPSNYPRNDQSCSSPGSPLNICTTDQRPFVNDMHEAGRDAGRGIILTRAPVEVVDGVIKYSKPGPQPPGFRSTLAVVDTATAMRYGLPTAKLRHASPKLGADGPFVASTTESMLADLAVMKSSGVPGVLAPEPLPADPAAYPLTMVSYAATAPGLLDGDVRKDYAAFLRFVADQGQVPGLGPGQLPFGYVPLPETLRAQTRAAATVIEAQPGGTASESTPAPATVPGARITPPVGNKSLTPADSAATKTVTPTPAPAAVAAPPGAAAAPPSKVPPVGRVSGVRRTLPFPAPAVGALLVALLVCGGVAAVLAPLARYLGVIGGSASGEGGDATDRTAPWSRLFRFTARSALFARRR